MTSLVGSTGADLSTLVTLTKDVFIGGNTGDDAIITQLGTGNNNLTNWDIRMGGGDDTITTNDTFLNSEITLDGLTAANDGNDTYTGGANLILNSDIRAMGGNDVLNGLALTNSTVNGNAGVDSITFTGSNTSTIYGGQGIDTIVNTATALGNSTAMNISGNKGADNITLLAGGFSGEIYGGKEGDVINVAAITKADTTAKALTDTGVTLSGDIGADAITGSRGVDTIFGGDGADSINGTLGADLITMGTGRDVLTTVQGAVGAGIGQMVAGTNVGFVTLNDFNASTSATAANGDTIITSTATTTVTTNAAAASAGVSLQADLVANAGGMAAAGDIDTVTITGAVAWAGTYILVEQAGDNAFGATDSAFKSSSIANVTQANLANFTN
ncbi:calcium-binding protein [Synechococcus sp. AH-551-G15]|nr:calcium-binding protein [Synechococcus sp. AH-551-G15]